MYYHTVYIGVNYNTPDKALEWADSIYKTNPESLIVIVDNSKIENLDLKIKINKFGIYKWSGKNLGYFNGAAYGLHSIEEEYIFDWVVVSNVDIKLVTKNVDCILDKFPNAGVIAPGIISYDTGFDKNPYRLNRSSKKTLMIKKIAFSNSLFALIYGMISNLRNAIIRKKYRDVEKCNEGEKIYLPYGAVLYFSKCFFDKGCFIDFPLFLFGEELFVAEQCIKANVDILYVPSIRFLNYEHASTSLLSSNTVRKRNYEAISYLLKEFYGD